MNRSRLVARLATLVSLVPAVVSCGPDAPTTPPTPSAAVVQATAGAQANAGGVTIAAPASTRLHPGDKIQLTATVVLPNGKDKDKFPIKWSTSSAAVATVDEKTGEVTAVAPGAVTITAKAGPRTGQLALTVMVPVARVTISPNPVTMDWNTQDTAKVILSVAAFDASGAPISDLAGRTIVWKSDDTTTATVAATDQPGQARATGVLMGKTTISATVDGARGTAQLTVQPEFGYFNNGGYDQTLNLGDATFLKMNFVSTNGERSPVDADQWVSTNPAVLTVTPPGPFGGDATVTAVGLGTASIEGTYRGFTLTATITVVATVAAIDVNLTTTTLTVGQTTQATAVVYTDRRAILTGAVVTWQSSDPGVASVSSSGVVTALAPGIARIDATVNGITGSNFVTVNPP
jgi:trimeric autotransporter adhesin